MVTLAAQIGFGVLYIISEVAQRVQVLPMCQRVINEKNLDKQYLDTIILLLVVELYRRSNLVYENTSQQGIMVGEDLPRIKSQYIMTLI